MKVVKRTNGEGSIYKTKNKETGREYWKGYIAVPNNESELKIKCFYGRTQKEVLEKLNIYSGNC